MKEFRFTFPFQALLFAVLLAGGASPVATKTQDIRIAPHPQNAAPVSEGHFDHRAYDAMLRNYVDGSGGVAYARWKKDGVAPLREYLELLADADPSELANRQEQLAFWINAYNALTLYGILEFYPTKSIKDHVSYLWGFNFWKNILLEVGGEDRSLDDIEHKILRPMREPRIHFAIVCASRGCPPLRAEAYTGEKLEQQLSDNARRFFSDPLKFRLDKAGKTLFLSPILKWFEGDFGAGERAMLQRIGPWIPDREATEFLGKNSVKIEWLDYDWAINDQHPLR